MSEAATAVKEEATEKLEFRCPVKNARQLWADFLEEKMCGKCHPCMMGSYEAVLTLDRISSGGGTEGDMTRLEVIVDSMLVSSRCKKGKDVAKAFAKILADGLGEVKAHMGAGARCPAHECAELISYEIDVERCTMCGECLKACRFGAIQGEKKTPWGGGYMPFRIRQLRCTRCDECRVVCPDDAIRIVDANAAGEPADA